MPGTVPQLNWPMLGAVINSIINVHYRKDVPSRPPRYADMPPLQKAALPETTSCSRHVWLSNTKSNLGPAHSPEKDHMALCRLICQRDAKHQICIPGCQWFLLCLACHVGILPFGGGSASCWAGLQPLEAAATSPECKISAGSKDARGAGGSWWVTANLEIMMIIYNISTVQFRSLCSSHRPRPLPREVPHANLPLI